MPKLKITPKIVIIKGKRYAVVGRRKILIKDNDIGERELIKFLVKHLKPRRKQKRVKKYVLNVEPNKSSISTGSLNPISLFDQIQKVKNDVNDKQLVTSKNAHGLNDEIVAYLNEFVKRVNQNAAYHTNAPHDAYYVGSQFPSFSTPPKQKVHIIAPPSDMKGIEYNSESDQNNDNDPNQNESTSSAAAFINPEPHVQVEDEPTSSAAAFINPEPLVQVEDEPQILKELNNDLIGVETLKSRLSNMKKNGSDPGGTFTNTLKNLALKYDVAPSTTAKKRARTDVIKEIIKNINQRISDNQYGNGGLKQSNDDYGLNTDQINQLMSKYGSEYLGTIARDEMQSLIQKVKGKSRGGFIINTQKSNQPGQHWQAVFYDARPSGSNSIEFYDSFGRDPSKSFMKDVKILADKLNAETYLKFKINKIIQQSNTSSNCGYFASKFLIDRFRGKPFRECTGYDEHTKDEKDIEEWKRKLAIKPFKYLPSFQDGAGIRDFFNDAYERVKAIIFGKTRPPPNVRKLINDHGKSTIKSIMVCRNPIESGLKSLLNAVSGSTLEKAQQRLNYDNIYHLFLNITLDDGYSFTIERNQSVNIGPSTTKYQDQRDVNMGDAKIDLATFISKGAKSPNFWNYSTTNNCQLFCKTLLQSNGLYTKELNDFIMQDVNELFKDSPLTQKIADGITEIAGRVDSLLNGAGKKKKCRK
jgi:hypothetical protein